MSVRIDPRVKTPLPDLTIQFQLSRSVTATLSRLVRARADVAERLGRASGDTATALRQVATELQAAFAPLPDLLDALQEADAKPLPRVEAAVNEALKRADAALARVPSGHS